MLTPLDLNSKTFAKGFRGYDADEVNEFFAQVSKDYERLYQDNVELKDTVERVSAKLEYYQHMEGTMQSTLTVAQETADEVKKSSEQKAELLAKKTDTECAQKRADAEAYVNKVKSEAEAYADKVKGEADAYAEKCKNDAQAFIDKMRGTAEMEVAKLKVDSDEQSKKLLADAREQAHTLITEATTRSRKMLDDATEDARRKMFEAESKAATAMSTYEDQMKKAAMHRNTVISFLETQLQSFKNFDNGPDAAKAESAAAAAAPKIARVALPQQQILVQHDAPAVPKAPKDEKPLAHPKDSLPAWMK
jgi:cell division initiation protein